LWFSQFESWSQDVSRLSFQSLGLCFGLETESLGLRLRREALSLGFGLGLEEASLDSKPGDTG